MKHQELAMPNIFHNIPKNAPDEIFETLINSSNIRIERIISNGQSTPQGDWYDQDENEWVLVLKGKAALKFEGETTERVLEAGDYLDIPAHVRHRVEWTSKNETTIWLAIFY